MIDRETMDKLLELRIERLKRELALLDAISAEVKHERLIRIEPAR
jgi:hypothetical protein